MLPLPSRPLPAPGLQASPCSWRNRMLKRASASQDCQKNSWGLHWRGRLRSPRSASHPEPGAAARRQEKYVDSRRPTVPDLRDPCTRRNGDGHPLRRATCNFSLTPWRRGGKGGWERKTLVWELKEAGSTAPAQQGGARPAEREEGKRDMQRSASRTAWSGRLTALCFILR